MPCEPKRHTDAEVCHNLVELVAVNIDPASRIDHDFNNLFLFSFLFNLSTLFLCIVSANFSYLAFSSFAALFSFSAWILLCKTHQPHPPAMIFPTKTTYLSLSFLLLFHLLLLGLNSSSSFTFFLPFLVGCQAGRRTESGFLGMPLLSCTLLEFATAFT